MNFNIPPHWQHKIALDNLNTMACPSVAEYYLEAATEAELIAAITAAKNIGLPWFILGGGSNVLCLENINGLIIRPLLLGKTVEHHDTDVLLTVGAGENWHALVEWSLQQGFYGLENLALIPGNAGAAPIQNIGAYGVEISERLHSVRFYDDERAQFIEFAAKDCELAYRDSIFKNALKDKAVISRITLKLSRIANPNISYAPLQHFFANSAKSDITPQAVFNHVCHLRNSRLPNPADIPNSGSFFKNPILGIAQLTQLQQQYPAIPSYPYSTTQAKVPAAWLIDQAGLKGEWVGQLRVHTEQALVLTNPNKQPITEVILASEKIIKTVFEKFGVLLEREPQVLGAIN